MSASGGWSVSTTWSGSGSVPPPPSPPPQTTASTDENQQTKTKTYAPPRLAALSLSPHSSRCPHPYTPNRHIESPPSQRCNSPPHRDVSSPAQYAPAIRQNHIPPTTHWQPR